MKPPYTDRFDQATDTLSVTIDGGVVRVEEEHDTWLCLQKAWCEARAQLRRQAPVGGDDAVQEARSDLREAVSAPILSLRRADRGSLEARRDLAARALEADLLPPTLKGLVQGPGARRAP